MAARSWEHVARLTAIESMQHQCNLIRLPDAIRQKLLDGGVPAEAVNRLTTIRKLCSYLGLPEVPEDYCIIESLYEAADVYLAHYASRPEQQGSYGEPDGDALLSASRLAEMSGDNLDALRQRLRRYRKNNFEGWVENTERGPNDPQFVYRYSAVKHLLK